LTPAEEAKRAAEEAAARQAAQEAAALAAEYANAAAGPQYAGEEEWEEWGEEEEGGYEYVSNHGGKEEGHVEAGVLVQPLGEGTVGREGSDEGTASGSTVPFCTAGSEGPCARDTGGGRACPPQYKECGPHRHRRNPCAEEVRTAKECREHGSNNPARNAECAVVGGVIGVWNPFAGGAAGYACSELID
jgi:hypothetical protein